VNQQALILRETAVSAVINAGLSILFFLLLFGVSQSVRPNDLAPDFFPQSFMVALMGSLVPSLLLRRKIGGHLTAILIRAVTLAIGATLIAGGAGYLTMSQFTSVLPLFAAIAIKAIFGAALAIVVTPLALQAMFKTARKDA
jgi:hypothetical protein